MNKKILVVEDEKNISGLLEYNLKKEGYDVETAADGLSGLEKANVPFRATKIRICGI